MSAKSRGRKGNAKGTKGRSNKGGFKKGVESGKVGNSNAAGPHKKRSGKKKKK